MKLTEIAEKLQCTLVGDGSVEILRVCGIDEAGPGDLTFIANRKYLPKLKTTNAAAIILGHEHPETSRPSLRSDNPYLAFAKAVELFYQSPQPVAGLHPTAVISTRATVGRNPSVGPYVVVGDDVRIGDNVTLHPHVCIYPGARLGNDCILHSHVVVREHVVLGDRVIVQNGAVIGGDGFGFARKNDGTFYKIVQSGNVVLEDDVEIGAHTTIDRATIGTTLVKKGAKLDNLVQIGHGSKVGEHCLLAAQSGLAGSSVLERHVTLAGQVGVVGHLTMGEYAIATAQSGVPRDVPAHAVVSGSPAVDNTLWRKVVASLSRIPDALKRLRSLEAEIETLKQSRSTIPRQEPSKEERQDL